MRETLTGRFPEATVERTVEWVDTDASGHQHNSAVLRWVEAAEATLFRNLALPDYFPCAPRVQQVVNFRSKIWFGQRVKATIAIRALGRTSMTLEFQVSSFDSVAPDGAVQDAGTLVASGTVTTVHVPQGSLTAEPWPDHFIQAIWRACPGLRS